MTDENLDEIHATFLGHLRALESVVVWLALRATGDQDAGGATIEEAFSAMRRKEGAVDHDLTASNPFVERIRAQMMEVSHHKLVDIEKVLLSRSA